MATNVKKYIIQSNYFIDQLNKLLIGDKSKREPGMVSYHSQIVDIYSRLRDYVGGGVTHASITSRSPIDTIRCKYKITDEEFLRLFLVRKLNLDVSTETLVDAFDRLINTSAELSERKNKIIFSNKGFTKAGIYKDLISDHNWLCHYHNKFKRLINAYEEFKSENANWLKANMSPSGKENTNPMTDSDKVSLEHIDREYKRIVEIYNESVFNSYTAIKDLAGIVAKLINERVSKYTPVLRVVSTRFDKPIKYNPLVIPQEPVFDRSVL